MTTLAEKQLELKRLQLQKLQMQRDAVVNPEVDFSLGEMLSNVPSSGAEYLGNTVNAIAHPVDTGKAIWDLGASVVNKGGRKINEMVSGVDIPSEPGSEDAANAVGEFYKNRYGSMNAFKKALMEDPVGVMADFSMAGIGLPGKAGSLAAKIEPLTATIRGAQKVIPEGAARGLYERAAKFGTTLDPADRQRMIETALKEGVLPTQSGVAKVENRIDILNAQIDDLISQAEATGATVPVTSVLRYVDDLRMTKGGIRLDATKDLSTIDKIKGNFLEHLKENGITEMTPEQLQSFKKDVYQTVNYNAKRGKGSKTGEETRKAVGRAAKEDLEGIVPAVKDINRQLSELYELQPNLIRSANRIGNRNLFGLPATLAMGAGAGVGIPLGATAGAASAGVAGILAAIATNPQVATQVSRLLDMAKKGNIQYLYDNIHLPEVQMTLSLMGRNEGIQEE